jgi:hypothetical protein
MTRYILAHEYGHHVQFYMDFMKGDVLPEYQAMRGGSIKYAARQWHQNVGELFANDFRILVAGIEMDFWPHPGFDHPHKNKDVQRWWADAVQEIEGVV